MLMVMDGDAAYGSAPAEFASRRVPWAGLRVHLWAAALERPMPGFPWPDDRGHPTVATGPDDLIPPVCYR